MLSRPTFSPFSLRKRTRVNLRLWVMWLVVSVCVVGTLGQVHRLLHAPLPGLSTGLHATASAPEPLAPAQAESHSHGAWEGLFGTHTEVECRLFDQLLGDPVLLAAPWLNLTLQLPNAQLRWRAGEFVARWVALFDARGPPASGAARA